MFDIHKQKLITLLNYYGKINFKLKFKFKKYAKRKIKKEKKNV